MARERRRGAHALKAPSPQKFSWSGFKEVRVIKGLVCKLMREVLEAVRGRGTRLLRITLPPLFFPYMGTVRSGHLQSEFMILRSRGGLHCI